MANRRPQGPQQRKTGPKHAAPPEIAGADSPTVELLAYNAVYVGRNGQRQAYHSFFGPQRPGYGYGEPDNNFGPDPRTPRTSNTLKEANLSARENGDRRINNLFNGAQVFADRMHKLNRTPDTTIERRTSARQNVMKRLITGQQYNHGHETVGGGWVLYQEGQEDKTPLHLSKYSRVKDEGTNAEFLQAKTGNWLIVVDEAGTMHFGDQVQLGGEGHPSTFQALGTIDLGFERDEDGQVIKSRQDEWAASGDNFSPGMVSLYDYDGKPAGKMDLTHIEGMLYAAGEAAGIMDDEDQMRTQPIPAGY